MSSLSLTRFKTGVFNDIYLIKNTGQSSIYDIFGTKTELSNLGGINTTTVSQITTAITALSWTEHKERCVTSYEKGITKSEINETPRNECETER